MKKRNDNDGVILFDKESGTNILLDEIKVEHPDISPRHISVALTNKCNMKCADCYIKQNDAELSLSYAKNLIRQLDEHGCLSIGLGGGEPTLWENLIELLDFIQTTQMGVTITTNGTATIETYNEIAKRVNLIRFSVDGIGSTYEAYRKQNYQGLIKKIKSLNCNIGLNYLLTNETVLQLDCFAKLIEEIRPFEALLLPCIDIDGERRLSKKSEQIIKEWVEKNSGKYPLAFSYSSIDMIKDKALSTQNFDSEEQAYYFLHINASGDIMKSAFDKSPIKSEENVIETIKKIRRK